MTRLLLAALALTALTACNHTGPSADGLSEAYEIVKQAEGE
jgi:hypothetical protein